MNLPKIKLRIKWKESVHNVNKFNKKQNYL